MAGSQSPEYRFADSGWLFKSAQQLLNGDRKALLTSLSQRRKDPIRAQAAGLIMVFADDSLSVRLFSTPLIRLVADPNAILAAIGHKEVERQPDWAIYVLREMVIEGQPSAAYELTRFGSAGQEQLTWLARNAPAKGRAAAITCVEDLAVVRTALDDPDTNVVREAVRHLLYRTDTDPQAEDRLLRDSRPKVRVAAAILAGRWSEQNWPLWVKLCHDPLPQVRRVAVLHMAALGLSQGQGPWVSDGIAAVKDGLHDRYPMVRETAVMAIRGWMLEWDKIHVRWTSAQVTAAESIIGSAAFHAAIAKQAKLSTIVEGSEDREGIQMVPAVKALVISNSIRSH